MKAKLTSTGPPNYTCFHEMILCSRENIFGELMQKSILERKKKGL